MLCDPDFKPWRAEALKRGYASSIALPLLAEGKAFGALTIYSKEPDPFSQDELALLSELASDLGYGIQSFRIRAAKTLSEEALRESEDNYRRLIENVNDLVCEVDSQARYQYVNSQYEQVLGYAPSELLGHYVRELIHPDDLQLSTPTFKKLVDGRTISRNEWRFKHKNGEWRWFDCVAQTFEKSPGDVHVVVISRDISERRQMEQDLRRSEERYRSLFDGMTEGFALHEISCDENGKPCDYRFLEINPSFERLTGLEAQNVVGKLMSEVLPTDDPNWVRIYGEVALTGVPVHFENYSPALDQYYEVFAYRPAPRQFAVIFMNITERKHMEKKLNETMREAERRAKEAEEGNRILDSLLEYIPEGITIASAPDVITLKTSKFGDRLLTDGWDTTQGLSMEDWLGKVEHFLEDGVTPARAADLPLWRAVKYGEMIEGKELLLRRPNGDLVPVLCNAGPIRDKDGLITGGIVAWRNIAERKRAEADLKRAHDELELRVRERTEQLQAANEALIDEISERLEAEATLRQNSARTETLAELSHKLATALLNLQSIYEIIVRSVAEHVGDACSLYILSDDGEWLNPAALFIPDPVQHARLNKTISHLPLRVEGEISEQIIRAGQSMCFSQVTPQRLADMTRPEYLPIVDELQVSQLLVVPLRQEGKTIGALAITRSGQGAAYTPQDQDLLESLADRAVLSITKARLYQDLELAMEREQQTRQQLILAEKNSALARMVASIAHEINNPIQTISNCMFLLRGVIDADSEAGEILNMASSEANRIGDLVARLRELYKPSKESTPKAFNILDVLYNVHSLLVPHLQHHNVKWEIICDTDLALVNGIPDQIKQVFLNICLNAIDAMEQIEGRLTVKVSTPATSQVCISFTDNGRGISPQDMPHIFEPFYTTKEKGSGLGLSICYEIVKNFDGSISVESQPGQGTTFRIELPALSN
jgi:PAS domain S-box-containing protein